VDWRYIACQRSDKADDGQKLPVMHSTAVRFDGQVMTTQIPPRGETGEHNERPALEQATLSLIEDP
jgi:hypothetical protein